MIYDVRHVTTYTYGSPVTFAQCTLRMLPSTGVGQTVLSRTLTIDPPPLQPDGAHIVLPRERGRRADRHRP